MTPTLEKIMQTIADNLPSPYAIDVVWRTTDQGPEFDLSMADDTSRSEWESLGHAVAALYGSPPPNRELGR